MSIKTMFLKINQLKGLKIDLHFIASKELLETLDEAIEENQGNYLCNIFSDSQIRELKNLKQNYKIKVFMG